jgi:PAS domain S-box-containing protein
MAEKRNGGLLEANYVERALAAGNLAWWIWDVETGHVDYSPEKATMLGYDPSEFPNTVYEITDLIHPEDHDKTMNAMRDHLTGKKALYEAEYRMQTKDGGYLWYYDRGMISQRKSDGSPAVLTGIVINFDPWKKAEQAIRLANTKLNLLSSITRHDILNSVTVLLGNLEFAREEATPATEEYIDKALASAKTIQRQIEFTRDYQNVGITEPKWYTVSDLVDRAAAQISLKTIAVGKKLPKVECYADPLIERVFYNLIENAIRHGGSRISRISFSCREEEGGIALLCEDDGSGVPKDKKNAIFVRGYYTNTGFGLFLSREILSITQMTISEEGIYGEGARFAIHIPKGSYRVL